MNTSCMMMFIFQGIHMVDDQNWESKVKGLLKAELKRRNVTYPELVEKLSVLGVAETPENIANKISRGKFTAVFMMQCLEAIDCKTLRLGE